MAAGSTGGYSATYAIDQADYPGYGNNAMYGTVFRRARWNRGS